jgi:hypothetical protein
MTPMRMTFTVNFEVVRVVKPGQILVDWNL